MKNTSTLGRLADILFKFTTILFTYPLWILITVAVVCNLDFHPDYANYWSLIVSIMYYLVERCNLPLRLLKFAKGKWIYPGGQEYHQKELKFIINNLLPLLCLPMASLVVCLFPRASFNSNGFTFLAMFLAILTSNYNFK